VRTIFRSALIPVAIFVMALFFRILGSGPKPQNIVLMRAGFAGCVRVVRDAAGMPTCEVTEPRQVRFALPRSLQNIEIFEENGHAKSRLSPELPDLGETERPVRVAFSAGAERLILETRAQGSNERHRFTLGIRSAPSMPWLEEAQAARARGDLGTARARLAEHPGDPFSLSLLARIQLAEGRAEESFPTFERAIAAHRADGRLSDAVDDTFALAFALHQRSHQYDRAKAALDSLGPLLDSYPEGAARAPYYRGVLAGETGDHRAAASHLLDAITQAGALGLEKLERLARSALALEHLALGRSREAKDILAALESDATVTGCERAEILNNLGWVELSSTENPSRLAQAQQWLERSASTTGCSDAYVTSFALANLARVAIEQGNNDEASKRLKAARARVREPRGTEHVAWLDLEGRLALSKGKPNEAIRRFDEELALATSLDLLDAVWSAELGRAEAHVTKGDRRAAIGALESAEDALDRLSLLAPLGGGLASYVGLREQSARLAVDLLVHEGRAEQASRFARRSIGRILRPVTQALRVARFTAEERASWTASLTAYQVAREQIEQQAALDWTLPTSDLLRATRARAENERKLHETLEHALAELERTAHPSRVEPPPSLARNELEVLLHPTRGGWVALLRDATQTTAHPIPPPTNANASRVVMSAISPRLSGITRIRVLSFGAYRLFDVHAIPLDGPTEEPLLARAQIEYSPGIGEPLPWLDAEARSTAIIIGDPTSDLPHARDEAFLVERALSASFGKVTTLLGAESTHRALSELLPTAGWMHFGGHASYAGSDGVRSSLSLANDGRFTVEDVLALPRAPRMVVLGACDAARSEGGSEGLGLAQAFLVAGSHGVLAPTRPVPDMLAAKLARALYAAASEPAAPLSTRDLSALARNALLSLKQDDPSADWAAYRVLTP
jgi:tetratricopeptide (TPR) repeat protein